MLYFFTAGKTLETLALRVVCKELLRCTVGRELLLEAGMDEHKGKTTKEGCTGRTPHPQRAKAVLG